MRIESAVRAHLGWIAVIVLLGCGCYLWLQEHDRLILSEETVHELQQTIDQRKLETAAQVNQIKAKAAQVKTPAQAIPVIPDVLTLPARIVPIAQLPGVTVAADAPSSLKNAAVIPEESVQPLYQSLAQCRVDQIELGACKKDASDMASQIKALKPSGFWQRLKNCGVRIGTNAATGAVFGKRDGAIVGAGIGTMSCFLWR